MDIKVDELLITVEHDYEDFHLSMDCFWCEIIAGKPELKEHEAARWLTINEIWAVDWLPADVEVVKRIEKSWIK